MRRVAGVRAACCGFGEVWRCAAVCIGGKILKGNKGFFLFQKKARGRPTVIYFFRWKSQKRERAITREYRPFLKHMAE